MRQFLLFFVAVLSRAACLPVESDRVLARDITAAVPEFAKVSPEELVTYAPLPGVKRLLTRGELVRIGRRLGIEIGAGDDRLLTHRDIRYVRLGQRYDRLDAVHVCDDKGSTTGAARARA